MFGRPVKSLLVPWLDYVPTPRYKPAPVVPVTSRSIVFDYIKANPYVSTNMIANGLGWTDVRVSSALQNLEDKGLVFSTMKQSPIRDCVIKHWSAV